MANETSSFLPENKTKLEQNLEQVLSANTPLHLGIKSLWNVDTIPANLLGVLAWSLSVDEWQDAWPESVKRQVIKNSYQQHAHKGSIWSVKKALESIGFGANSEILEGSETRHYNGTLFADGSAYFEGESWAKYSIKVDLGENQGIALGVTANARSVIERAAPARCYLTDIGWKSDTQDQVATSENSLSDIALPQQDITPWLKRYDGAQSHNQGLLITANGLHSHNGTLDYLPTATTSETALSQSDQVLSVNLQLSLSDNQRITKLFDGTVLNDGFNESELLFAEDAPMPIQVTEWHIQNGKHSYAGGFNFHNGQITAAGQAMYFGTKTYSGIKTTYLTVH